MEFKSQTGQIFTASQMVRHRFNIYAVAVLPWRYDVEMGTATRYTFSVIRRVQWKVWRGFQI